MTRSQHLCRECKAPIKGFVRGTFAPKVCLGCHVAAQRTPKVERTRVPYRLTRQPGTTVRPGVATPKDPPHRSRTLLDLAHAVHFCMNCEAYVESGCEPAHANGAEWGKGLSQKADDWAHCALCHACHGWLDQLGLERDPSGRYAATYTDRRAMWTAAYFKTTAFYWKAGWIKVSPGRTHAE